MLRPPAGILNPHGVEHVAPYSSDPPPPALFDGLLVRGINLVIVRRFQRVWEASSPVRGLVRLEEDVVYPCGSTHAPAALCRVDGTTKTRRQRLDLPEAPSRGRPARQVQSDVQAHAVVVAHDTYAVGILSS